MSAEAEASATISGPPSTLATLFSSDAFYKQARKVKLPIAAAFHAPHLSNPDYDVLLTATSDYNDLAIRDDIVVMSASSAKPAAAASLGDLLKQVVADTFQNPIRWSQVAHEIIARLAGGSASIHSAGPVHAANSLSREMSKANIEIVERTEMQPSRDPSSCGGSNDIAIVGFASRLPEAETLEEVWELLEKGRDVQRKVRMRSHAITM